MLSELNKMTVLIKTVRNVMGWCPNENAGRLKSSQQIDFVNTKMKPSGIKGNREQMGSDKEIKIVLRSLVALSILIIWQFISYLGSDMNSPQTYRFTIGTSGLAIIWMITMVKFRRLYREKADRE
jgi:hypothetical protein